MGLVEKLLEKGQMTGVCSCPLFSSSSLLPIWNWIQEPNFRGGQESQLRGGKTQIKYSDTDMQEVPQTPFPGTSHFLEERQICLATVFYVVSSQHNF